MGSNTQHRAVERPQRLGTALPQPGEAVEIVDEAPLPFVRRRAAEARMGIEDRQKR